MGKTPTAQHRWERRQLAYPRGHEFSYLVKLHVQRLEGEERERDRDVPKGIPKGMTLRNANEFPSGV